METLLLTPSEVAEALALSKTKIYELLSEGTIPSLRIGGSIRVPRETLREWISRRVNEQGETK
jgi:excisionase family DNA binding protein